MSDLCRLFRTPPQPLQRDRKTLGLDPVRWVEVVPPLEHLELEVREHSAQPLRDLPVLVRVAERAEGEVDGAIETAQGIHLEQSSDARKFNEQIAKAIATVYRSPVRRLLCAITNAFR